MLPFPSVRPQRLADLLGSRNNLEVQRAMILGAGFGTRLLPLTDELPKAAVPVGDRPLLAHVAFHFESHGTRELALNVHHRSDKLLSNIEQIGVKFHVLREPKILGTAGGIRGAMQWLGPGPVVVANGDILCRPPLDRARQIASDGLTLVVAAASSGQGTVGLGSTGEVVRLRGRIFGEEVAAADYVGVAILGTRCLATLPEQGCLIGDWALPELERGGRIGTLPLQGDWLDVGSKARYLRANLKWLEEQDHPRAGWFAPVTRGGEMGPELVWRGSGAQIAPQVTLERSVIGAGAVVEGEGQVSRCVVWPGARARAPLSDAVVTTSGRVVSCLDLR